MPNIIQIKRRTGADTAPTTTDLKQGELGYVEGTAPGTNGKLFIGVGVNGNNSNQIVAIGGPGAYMTFDTAQTPTGVKTFSNTTLRVTGATSTGQVLSVNNTTTGELTWTSITGNSYSTISGNTGSAISASGAETLNLRGTGAISVATTAGSPDLAEISVTEATVSNSALGVVRLSNSITTDTDRAVTPAAIKGYVDSQIANVSSGLDVKASVRAASTVNLTGTYTYTPGTVGILESSVNASLPSIDTINLVLNDRVLLKDQTDKRQNGIYSVKNVGSGSTKWRLERTTDANTNDLVTPGMFTFVEQGSANADTGWILITDGTVIITNTTLASNTDLNFTQFAGVGTVTAGTGLSRNLNEISLSIPVVASNGGTGYTTYTTGDLLVGAASNTLSKLAAVAVGNVLISGGAAAAPSWGKVGLTSHVTGILALGNGGTGATSAPDARINLGATTVGSNIFTLTNPSAITFLRLNADNTVTALNAGDFRTAIGAGTGNGTVTSVSGSAPITVTGTNSVSVSLAAAYGDTANPYGAKTAKHVLMAPNAADGAPGFRALLESDLPNISANKITAGTVTGKIGFANLTSTSSPASINVGTGSFDPASPGNGDFWNNNGTLKFHWSSTKTILHSDSLVDAGAF